MIVFGRTAAAFCVLMVVGYLMLVTLVPAPAATALRLDDGSGASAAIRLSQEARILVSRKPAGTLQAGTLQ